METRSLMKRLHGISLLGCVILAAAAQAAPGQDKQDVVPSGDKEGVVHVNAMRNPQMRSYRAIVAGLDAFDDQHALAPNVPRLLFRVESMNGGALDGAPPAAKIAADEFSLPLALDEAARFVVPRNQAAWDAKAELVLNRKKHEARVEPHVRTPGLADNQRRLGDIRLECRVNVAIAKEELPFFAVAAINGLLLTRDWCGWFEGDNKIWGNEVKPENKFWSVRAGAKISAATLRQDQRSLVLPTGGTSFRLPIGDASWGNDALVELEFAPADADTEVAGDAAAAPVAQAQAAGQAPPSAAP